MNSQQIIDLVMGLVYATAELAAPMLLTALAVGLLVSIFQAATQINEATLSFLPKIAAMMVVMILTSSWMVQRMTTYTSRLYKKIPEMTRVQH